MNSDPIKCASCGKFISYDAMQSGAAHFEFTPDSDRSREVTDRVCAECVAGAEVVTVS